jgi:hypothetical protein
MNPDLVTILITLALPLLVVTILAWRTALLMLANRRKRIYIANLHRQYRTRL